MKQFREKHPLLASLMILAVMFAGLPAGNVLVGIAAAVPPLTEFLGDYGIQLLAELSMLVVMVLMTFLWKMERVFTCRGRGFGQSLLPAAPLLALYAIAGVESLMFSLEGLMLGDGSPLQNPLHILLFVLCMAAVGVTEELTFRGMIAGMFYEKYGATPAGVWLSVMASSLLFGLVHITNAIGGAASLSGVLIQMVGAIALGMCLAALYFRCRNLWAVAAVHGFMDFCALLTSGVFQGDSLTDIIDGYSAVSLVSFGIYVVIALILLRPYYMRQITSRPDSDLSTTIKLGVTTGLVGVLVGAVAVLSVV